MCFLNHLMGAGYGVTCRQQQPLLRFFAPLIHQFDRRFRQHARQQRQRGTRKIGRDARPAGKLLNGVSRRKARRDDVGAIGDLLVMRLNQYINAPERRD